MRASGFCTRAILVFLPALLACEEEVTVDLVHIPDASFLQALVDQGADSDADGKISYAEAERIAKLDIGPYGIRDLTGLEAFVNLDSFTINVNPLVHLDISGNPDLSYLNCEYCDLEQLVVSGNPGLKELHCNRNRISELNLLENPGLVRMSCKNNELRALDLSVNEELLFMVSCGNQLSSIDLRNNEKLITIGIDNMPRLEEVCVWTLPFPPEGVHVIRSYSPNIRYTDTCSF